MFPAHAAQHTLRAPVTVSGVGVHSGAAARLTIGPAPAGSGIVFVRTDETGRDNVVPAAWDRVTETRLCTVIENAAGVRVSTVEHVLSALCALGVDNARIEIDGPEIPIMDGSAIAFLNAVEQAGLQPQSAPRRVLVVQEAVTFRDGDKYATLRPASAPSYAFDIDFDNALIGRQSFDHAFSLETYRRDIASARTFGFLHEVEQLRKMGLARGGSLENAVVVDGARVMNPEGLRFPDEFVRHKILDAVGDLYLAGMPILGRYEAHKAGHALNNHLLRTLFQHPAAWQIVEAPLAAAA